MPNVKVYDMKGSEVGEITLSDAVFGIEPNENAIHAVVKNHLANLRQGTQSTLTRAEVSGGGAKPWRQKGTGRARQGSTRSPQWTHGGIAFGPKPRDYSYRLNKKVRRLAILSALSAKAASGDIIVIENLNLDEIKTKTFAEFLKAVDAERKSLVVTPETRENIVKSARNIKGVKTAVSGVINVYDILNADKFIVDKDAVKKIEEVYAQ
ncbi:MAG: 50S ribosomal protein L4 [Bacillota bacterium]|nr:50S ribosomal protein L4 [Bacillota bacterium]